MGQVEFLSEFLLRINLDKDDSLLIVRNLLKFHNFVVVVNSILIDMVGQKINDMFIDIFDVEYFCELNIQVIFILLLSWKLFIYQMNLIMFLLKYSRVFCQESLLD